MKILFMGDGKWGELSLKELLKQDENIIGVVIRTNPSDDGCTILAQKYNIPLFQPDDINSDNFFNKVKKLDPDIIVSMSYDQIMGHRLINFPKEGIINVHAGMLPFYRGRAPINWAIINDEKYIGVTVHYIDENIDTGNIIIQEKINIKRDDNYKTLLKKSEEIAPKLLVQAIVLIKNNLVIPKKQSNIEGIYLPRREEGDEIIDWNWNSKRIHNFIRALVPPGPSARTFYGGREIKILKSTLLKSRDFIGNPGQIVGKDQNGIKVKTGNNIITLNKIIMDNKEKVPQMKIGSRLGINKNKVIDNLENKIKVLEKNLNDLKNDLKGDHNEK